MADTITPATSRHVEPDVNMQDLLKLGSSYGNNSVLPLFAMINAAQQRTSVLQQISPNYPMTLGDNFIMDSIESTAYVVGENNCKIASPGQELGGRSIRPFKIAAGIQYSMEDELRGGEMLMQNIVTSLASSIAKQIDMAGILGRQLSSGEVLENSSVQSIAQHSTRLNVSEKTPADETLFEAAEIVTSNGFTPNGLISTPALQAALLGQRDKNGQRIYGDGTVLGGNFGSIVGLPQTIVTSNFTGNGIDGGDINPDHVIGIVGDFSQIVFGTVDIDSWSYRRFDCGDPFGMGYDLALRNQVALRLETVVGVGVINDGAFVTIAAPGTPVNPPKQTNKRAL